jgi:hypothetical protein
MRAATLTVLLLCACGAEADEPVAPDAALEPACHWAQTDGCEPCADARDYGASNTCWGVIWRGRSESDFCLQSAPCDAPAQPVTRIPD